MTEASGADNVMPTREPQRNTGDPNGRGRGPELALREAPAGPSGKSGMPDLSGITAAEAPPADSTTGPATWSGSAATYPAPTSTGVPTADIYHRGGFSYFPYHTYSSSAIGTHEDSFAHASSSRALGAHSTARGGFGGTAHAGGGE